MCARERRDALNHLLVTRHIQVQRSQCAMASARRWLLAPLQLSTEPVQRVEEWSERFGQVRFRITLRRSALVVHARVGRGCLHALATLLMLVPGEPHGVGGGAGMQGGGKGAEGGDSDGGGRFVQVAALLESQLAGTPH